MISTIQTYETIRRLERSVTCALPLCRQAEASNLLLPQCQLEGLGCPDADYTYLVAYAQAGHDITMAVNFNLLAIVSEGRQGVHT